VYVKLPRITCISWREHINLYVVERFLVPSRFLESSFLFLSGRQANQAAQFSGQSAFQMFFLIVLINLLYVLEFFVFLCQVTSFRQLFCQEVTQISILSPSDKKVLKICAQFLYLCLKCVIMKCTVCLFCSC
jgi:ABC-type sulfate transport system permease subunit